MRWTAIFVALAGCGSSNSKSSRDLAVAMDAGADLAVSDLAGCTSTADCPDDHPICDSRVCRACSGSGDDATCAGRSAATPRCFAASGSCAACAVAGVQSSDCATATPICGSGGVCRACTAHAECSAQLCSLDGSCADGTTIAYADNAGGTCTGTHAATAADPACDITAALAVEPLVPRHSDGDGFKRPVRMSRLESDMRARV